MVILTVIWKLVVDNYKAGWVVITAGCDDCKTDLGAILGRVEPRGGGGG